MKKALEKTLNAIRRMLPVLVGVLLLVSLFVAAVPKEFYSTAFSGGFLDPVIGAVLGSVAAGNPATSYVLGGELLAQGISLAAITAFLTAWVTVGLVQFPAESVLMGKRFALVRNATAFASSIAVAWLTVFTLGLI